MNTDIIQILNSSEIGKILRDIADNGIPIIDTWAPWTFGSNIITTLVGTFIATLMGARVTMYLFKRQEKFRIKEEIRLDFYKQYQELYELVLETFWECNDELKRLEKIISYECAEDGKTIVKLTNFIGGIKSIQDTSNNYDITLKKSRELIGKLKSELEKLDEFINSKKIITGYNEGKYKDIITKINRIYSNYRELCFRKNHATDSEYLRVQNKLGLKNTEQLTYQQKVDVVVEGYKEKLDEFIVDYKKIEVYTREFQDINSEIEDDFIGQYFKKITKFK